MAAGLLLLGLLSVVVPAPEAAAATAPGPLVALPFSTESSIGPARGGAGSLALNQLVAQGCNGGAAIGGQQWFTLPHGDLGSVLVRGQGTYYEGAARSPSSFDERLAVVDYVTGAILGCGPGPVTVRADHAAAMVIYFQPAELEACRADESCYPDDVRMAANKTAGVPTNDNVQNANLIDAVPFVADADSSMADDDGPDLLGSCGPSEIDPQQYGTVWWRYTPPVSGDLPVSVAAATFGPPVYEPLFPAFVGMAQLTSSGPVRVGRPLDDDGCETGPFRVQAGTTYLIGVYLRHDTYYRGAPLLTGAPFTLRVGAPTQPTAPQFVRLSKDDAARTATINWGPPASDGGSTVTGYRVSRDGTDSAGTGAFATTVSATTRSFTFSKLLAGSSYRLSVQAVNATGTGLAGSGTVTMAGGSRTVTLNPVADTMARQQAPTSGSGSATSLLTDTEETSGTASRATPYLRFTVPTLAAGESIASARLSLQVTNGTTNGPAIWRTATTWSESTLTWNSGRPARSGTAAIGNYGSMATGRISTPVSGITSSGTVSLQLFAEATDGAVFSSRESTTTSNRPRLVLTINSG